ncbi:hypothetical protein DXG01_007787 [Tephrocybe rancida]|nr:hypothetical protein DXG01_007787 [Tephrocybe rancida]
MHSEDSSLDDTLEHADVQDNNITSLCHQFADALFCDNEKPNQSTLKTAIEELSEGLRALGLDLLINKLKHDGADDGILAVSAAGAEDRQSLVDDLFVALYFHPFGPVLASKILARIWLSTRLLPSPLRLEGLASVSSHAFATTASSNVREGIMADSTLVALKTFRRTRAQPPSEDDVVRFFFEALVSSTTRHRNIMPILGIHVGTSDDIYLVSKLHSYGSLLDYLAAHPEADKFLILEKLADAVVHLHSLPTPILHGDIRGMNILVDDNGEPLLIDFGFSLVLDPLTQTFCPLSHHFIGHPRWTPHEKIRSTEYPLTLKADSFSFASLVLEVLSDDVPYSYLSNNSAVIIEVVVRNRTPRRPDTKLLTDPLWDLLNRCWSRNPDSRPSMEDIRLSLASVCFELPATALA